MNRLTTTLRSRKIIVFGIADALLTAIALYLAFFIRFEGVIPHTYTPWLPLYGGMLVVLNIYFLWSARLYSFTWSFVGLAELGKLLKSISYASIVFAIIVLALRNDVPGFAGFPSSVLFITYVLSLILVGALRIAKRVLVELVGKRLSSNGMATLIVGAGAEGESLIRSIAKSDSYRIIGIVDDSPTKQRSSIHGFNIVGEIEAIRDIVPTYKVEQIIIALTSAESNTIRRAVTLARDAGIHAIKIIPATHELLSGTAKLTDFRKIQVEDLLGRNPATIDTKKISSCIAGKTVLITGAAGSIGSELARQCIGFAPEKLIALDFNESGVFDLNAELTNSTTERGVQLIPIVGNITDEQKIDRVCREYKPDVIFHAAAYKHVPLMEEFPEEAVAVNVVGTLTVAEAARRHNVATFVLISTDKAIRPISVMGKTKRAAELVTQMLNEKGPTKFVSVRFGNVIGSRGSVVPLFEEQIKRRMAVTVTHPDMTRYFMTIPEAALLVMEAGAVGTGGEIFMLDMGKPVKIVDVAREAIRLAGLEPDIDIPIVFTGVRSGEKIFEEIFSEEEKRIGATQWEKIFITKSDSIPNSAFIESKFVQLRSELNGKQTAIRKTLDEFVGCANEAPRVKEG